MKKPIKSVDSKFWVIPPEIYKPLHKEFKFDFDPCPYPFVKDGIESRWGNVNWVNPPFRAKDAINGHGPTAFVRKAIEEQKKGKTSVLILPVLSLFNLLIEAGAEMRSVGRVKWLHAETGEKWKNPSSCAVFILRGKSVKEFENDKKTKKAFREKLNKETENMSNEELAKGVNNRYKPRKRKYGDYLYHQDRCMFNNEFEAWKRETNEK